MSDCPNCRPYSMFVSTFVQAADFGHLQDALNTLRWLAPVGALGWIATRRARHGIRLLAQNIKTPSTLCDTQDSKRQSNAPSNLRRAPDVIFPQMRHSLRCRWMPLDAVGCCWMPLDAVGCRWMPLDAVGCRWMPLDALVHPVFGWLFLLRVRHREPERLAKRETTADGTVFFASVTVRNGHPVVLEEFVVFSGLRDFLTWTQRIPTNLGHCSLFLRWDITKPTGGIFLRLGVSLPTGEEQRKRRGNPSLSTAAHRDWDPFRFFWCREPPNHIHVIWYIYIDRWIDR